MDNWQLLENLNINLHNKKSGSLKTQCPKCSYLRKKKNDPCLSVDIDTGAYNCHNGDCDFHGRVFNRLPKKEYIRPPKRLAKLEPLTIDFFEKNRSISNNTLLRFNVTDTVEWMPAAQKEIPVICFNYYRDGELVNIKYRGKNKDFKLVKNAELIFYNLDAIKTDRECIICEGEIDCMSLYEAGFYNAVSVPNGASRGAQKLEYLDNCWQYFENKEKIILMTDGDQAGVALRDELARRIGKDKCWKVEYPEGCKDANEVLVRYGKTILQNVVANATEFPIEGVLTIGDDLIDEIYWYWEHGYPKGTPINIDGFDEHLLLQKGQFTTATGIPGSGKSEFIDYVMSQTAMVLDWKWCICSFENKPAIHATKIMQKLSGKAFAFRHNSEDRMSQNQFERALVKMHDNFIFVNLNEVDISIDGLLEKAQQLVRRKGINGLLIDPWNYVEQNRPSGVSETDYVSLALTKLGAFCKRNDTHGILVAHPTKLKKENGKFEIPNMYSISGSAHFFNKTDNGISVYRDFESGVITIYIQKVRDEWNGKQGYCQFQYDKERRQYTPIYQI